MDVELARTIAAIVSLGFGFCIFGFLVWRVYVCAPRLEMSVIKASIRAIDTGTFDCQIDLDIKAIGGDFYLKDFTISHPVGVFDPDREVNERTVNRLIENLGYCALDRGEKEFAALLQQSFDAAGLKLVNSDSKRFSIVDRISVGQTDNGYLNWPTDGWALVLRASSGKVRIPFAFSIHDANDVPAFCINYGASRSMIWSC